MLNFIEHHHHHRQNSQSRVLACGLSYLISAAVIMNVGQDKKIISLSSLDPFPGFDFSIAD
jgi:hypothetical protein